MNAGSLQTDFHAASVQQEDSDTNGDNNIDPLSPNTGDKFDESQCLFCNQMSPDLEHSLAHMLKAHGFYIDPAHLLVDIGSLLAYLHLVISECFECLYCGTQRNTREAVQQHMMAKGHCKYDITDRASELRDFCDLTSSDAEQTLRRDLVARRFSDEPQLSWQTRSRNSRLRRSSNRQAPDTTSSQLDEALSTPTSQSQPNRAPSSNAETPSRASGELSSRALRQEHVLNNQLSHLRAGDRRALSHLPTSRQRALLSTQHKQMEKATETAQRNRSNLESAGNKVNCQDKIRLIRKPPHTGNVASLKH